MSTKSPMLSPHFSVAEFACKHCGKAPIDKLLLAGLEEIRTRAGHPVHILSGYRCPEHNRRIGGAPGSMHIIGRAADIQVDQLSAMQVLEIVKQISVFTGYGLYVAEQFVHVDTRPNSNGQPATWGRILRHGSYTSLDIAEKNWKLIHDKT